LGWRSTASFNGAVWHSNKKKFIMSRPSNFNQIYSSQAVAVCSNEQAAQLVNFDHHRVSVLGQAGVLLTYEWLPLEEHVGPFVLTVVFHHAEAHPPAPAEVQFIVDRLKFQVRGQPR
jgi:hypothetical protein